MATVDVSNLRITISTAGDRQALSSLASVSRAVDTLRSNFAAGLAFSAGFAALNAGLSLLRDGFSAVGDAAIGLNAQLQQTEIGFKTMLGSAEAAKDMMAEITAFALNTPFELKGLSQTAAQFLAMGFTGEQLIPTLQMIGNASAALGTGEEGVKRMSLALAQMSATGKVMAQDMNQLTQARVPAWEILSKAIGKTTAETRKLAEQGKISSGVFLAAFEDMARNGKWADAMADQNTTFTTALNNSKEALQLFIAAGFKPLFEVVTEAVVKFRDFTKTAEWARWGVALQQAVEVGTAALKYLLNFLKPVGDGIRSLFNSFADFMGIPEQVIPPVKEIPLVFQEAVAEVLSGTAVLDNAIKAMALPLAHARLAVSDIKDAYAAPIAEAEKAAAAINDAFSTKIDLLKGQAAQFEKVADYQGQLHDLQLDTEASVLREAEQRERILNAGKDTITASGRFIRGRPQSETDRELRLLDIQSEQRKAKAKADWDEIQRQMAQAPFLAAIKEMEAAQKVATDAAKAGVTGLKEAQEAHLKPFEDQIKFQERQLALLQLQKQELDNVGAAAVTASEKIIGAVTGGDEKTADAPGFTIDIEALKKKGLDIGAAFLKGVGEALGKIPGLIGEAFSTTAKLVGDAFAAVWDWTPLWVTIYDLKKVVTRALSPDGLKAWESFRVGLLDAIDQKVQELRPGIQKMTFEISKGLTEALPDIARVFLWGLKELLILNIQQHKWFLQIGFDITSEITKGIVAGLPAAIKTLREMIVAALKTLRIETPWGDITAPEWYVNMDQPGGLNNPAVAPPPPPRPPPVVAPSDSPWSFLLPGGGAQAPINVDVGGITVAPGVTPAEAKEAEDRILKAVLSGILAAQQAAA